eukprot:Skav229539  [mRNA]  locus=scaffold568:170634:171404:+ [translate_table: standard]
MEGPPAQVGPTERPLEQNAREPKTDAADAADADANVSNNADANKHADDATKTTSSDKAFQSLSTVSAPPQFSFAAKFVGQNKNKMPGPGSYMNRADFSSRHRTVPSFGFGTNSRQIRHLDKTPGPGSYDAKQGTQGSQGWKIGAKKSSKEPRRQKNPGPGSYNLPEAFGRGRLTITPCRKEDRTLPSISVPGPGDYEVTVSDAEKFLKNRAPKFSFGTARQRARLPAEFEAVTPGPGAYRNHPELPHDPSLVRSRR